MLCSGGFIFFKSIFDGFLVVLQTFIIITLQLIVNALIGKSYERALKTSWRVILMKVWSKIESHLEFNVTG